MKLKPILLESQSSNSKLLLWDKTLIEHKNDKGPYRSEFKLQHIYLIDQEAEIKKGDRCYMLDEASRNSGINLLRVDEVDLEIKATGQNGGHFVTHKRWIAKIIASSYSAILPRLSQQSIKFLVDYYNKQGKMPDEVEIKIWKGLQLPNNFLDYEKEELLKNSKKLPDNILNPQGTIDIIIPKERMYSRDEVYDLFNNYALEVIREHYAQITNLGTNAWLDKNLK
jgi:hypothetical protein